MNKYVFTLLLIMLTATIALADRAELVRDAVGAKVQGFGANGREDVALTVKSQTVNMTNEIAWSVYSPGACKFRNMTTGTKAGLTRTIPAATYVIRSVHPKSMFLNFSGCTSGELQMQ